MIQFEPVARAAASDLHQAGAKFALIGGLAVSVRAEPRNTRDLDFAVAVGSDRDAESLIRQLLAKGYAVVALLEQQTRGRLATVRLLSPATTKQAIVVDLLFASCGIEAEVVAQAEPLDVWPDLRLPVARSSHLLAMKVLARDDRRRPQDRMDIAGLLAKASPHDLEDARLALRLITERGFQRDRNLLQDLDRALQEFR